MLGGVDEISELALKRDVSQVLIAVPTAGGGLIRRISKAATEAKLRVQVLPGVGQRLGRVDGGSGGAAAVRIAAAGPLTPEELAGLAVSVPSGPRVLIGLPGATRWRPSTS